MSNSESLEQINIGGKIRVDIINKLTDKKNWLRKANYPNTYKLNNCIVLIGEGFLTISGHTENVIALLKNSTIKTDKEDNLYEKYLLTRSIQSNNLSENIFAYNSILKDSKSFKFEMLIDIDTLAFIV